VFINYRLRAARPSLAPVRAAGGAEAGRSGKPANPAKPAGSAEASA
jgi:hypothetical protein